MKRLCVSCGSAMGIHKVYADETRAFGNMLVRHGWGLVFGGGQAGLMSVLVESVLDAGGEAIGVIPNFQVDRETPHRGLADIRIVASLPERKAQMAELSQAFVALPGGYGTADEFFELLTWAQFGILKKPIGVLNVAGFFDPLLAWIDRALAHGFIQSADRPIIQVDNEGDRLLERLAYFA
jgi:uncharacterized protein (TIGR00730 family)